MITRLIILTLCLLKVVPLLGDEMKHLTPLIEKETIAEKVKEVALQIQQDYRGKDLVVVMVLKGAICLVADLIRELNLPLDVETVQCSSYGARGTQRGELKVMGLERLNIHNRDVLVVDDIFDTGHTMVTLLNAMKELHPRSLKSCVLLNKNDVHKVTDYIPEYVLFDIPNRFVVGYGLDFKEQYRGLSGVYVLSPQ